MLLSLCLLLPALSPSTQEICSAPGALPAPTLYLSQTSARPKDSVWFKCFMFSQALATRVIFCKDGEEVSSQRGLEEKATYDYNHVVSRVSSGNYTCGYEIKDSDNRVNRSQLSPAQHLNLTGDDFSSGDVGGSSSPQGLDLKLLLGITIPAVLVLAVVLYVLGKKVVSLPRDQRVQHDTSNTPEDYIEYASVNWLGSFRGARENQRSSAWSRSVVGAEPQQQEPAKQQREQTSAGRRPAAARTRGARKAAQGAGGRAAATLGLELGLQQSGAQCREMPPIKRPCRPDLEGDHNPNHRHQLPLCPVGARPPLPLPRLFPPLHHPHPTSIPPPSPKSRPLPCLP
ncbi:uncharacterized protein ACDP82_020243 [Pangshura tecta]